MMAAAFAGLVRQTCVRYVLASVGALALDLGLFMALLHLGMFAAAASVIGYCAGIALHWLLSSRAVFAGAAAIDGDARHRRKLLFMGSALVGLMITTAMVGLGTLAGADPRIAKLVAVAISFQTSYWLRKRVVFA